jgi:hypothetical protein
MRSYHTYCTFVKHEGPRTKDRAKDLSAVRRHGAEPISGPLHCRILGAP